MAEKGSLQALASRMLQNRFCARYRNHLATDSDALLLPGEDQPRSLESFCLPLRFREMATHGNAIDIWDALFLAPRLAVVGEAGAGKTTTLRQMAVVLARNAMPEGYIHRLTFVHQGEAADQLLPIYADLALLDVDADDLTVSLTQVCAQHGFPGARGFLRDSLPRGQCLLLLDNLDALSTLEKRMHLKDLLAPYPRLQVVVAARSMHALNDLPGFVCLEAQPFSPGEVATFVNRRLGQDALAARALLQALERNHGLGTIAGNPFLLSVLAWASAKAHTCPLPLRCLYEQCLQTLLGDDKALASSSTVPVLDQQTSEQALQELALSLHERHLAEFEEEQLQAAADQVLQRLGHPDAAQAWLAWLQGSRLQRHHNGGPYAFLRMALQEYLTARAIVATQRFRELCSAHAGEPWWHEVLVSASALQGAAEDAIRHLLAADGRRDEALLLAARCAIESGQVPQDIRQSLRDRLFEGLERDDVTWWQDAAIAIAALEGQRARDYFLRALREGPIGERQRAALVLGRIGAPGWALEPLLGALDSTRPPVVRAQAAWALGQLRDRRAVQALMAALKEDNEAIAYAAAMALSVLGEPAVPSLIAALNSDMDMLRQMVVKSLARMGNSSARPLLAIVQDETQPDSVIKGAAEALGLLGNPQAIPPLVRLLRSRSGKVVEPAAHALAAIGLPAIQPLVDALPSLSAEVALSRAVVDALVSIGEPSIKPLLRALDSPSVSVRAAAEEALKGIGAPAIEALLEALRNGELGLRRRIAMILEQFGEDRRLAEPLLRMRNDKDAGVRLRVVHILGQIGREQTIDPLIDSAQHDPDESVRREAIRALMDRKDERAIGPLIAVLQDPHLRENAIAALAAHGEPAVEPLISAIHQESNPELREAYIKVLATIGSRGRVGDATLFALANVYTQLLTVPPGLDEMVRLLAQIRWWKHGEEVFLTFSSAQTLLKARTLQEVAQCPENLAWVDTVENPFRPALKDALWNLGNVAQSIRLYLQDLRREGQRDAMLSAINSIATIRQTVDTQLLDFEKRPFLDIMDSWQQLTGEALQILRGRAQLEIETLRDDLGLDSTQLSAVVVFCLTNIGDSPARNVTTTLRSSSGDGFQVIGQATQRLDPLGSGMERRVEFRLKPLGVTDAGFVLEVSYDDDEGPNHRLPYTGRVRFFALKEEYRPIPGGSPYVAGPVVKEPRMFFGRKEVFDWIRDNIAGTYQANILVLHGERRMGKTSILYQLLHRPPTPEHICVFSSLEVPPPASAGDWFYTIATEVHKRMLEFKLSPPSPAKDAFISDPQRAFLSFCDSVESMLTDRRLLIMVDEIDILIDKVKKGIIGPDIFHFLRGLMQHRERITFIFTGAYELREMLQDNRSILFNIARPCKISYLTESEARELIVKPVEGYLTYDDMVVGKIIKVSACHPYFVQFICDSLARLAQRLRKSFIATPELEEVLQDVIQDNAGQLQKAVYAVLSQPEQRALAALANITDDYQLYVPPEMLEKVLRDYKLDLPKTELLDALRSLRERDLVVEKRIGQSLRYGFKMDLIRMWIRQNEVLLRISQEMRI